MNEIFKRVLAEMEEDSNQIVQKSIPFRPEWAETYKEFLAIKQQLGDLADKAGHLHKRFWVNVESDLDYYGTMRVNEKKKCVEVLAEVKVLDDEE